MSLLEFQGAVELGLIYAILAIGLYISFRILNVADLTVEGSFTTGGAICAVFTAAGYPVLALPMAIIGGMMAGFVTGFLQTKLKIQPILAGILVMTALYSINLHIMGKPNVQLIGADITTIFDSAIPETIIILVIIAIIFVFLVLFFKTTVGLSIRATGDNPIMVNSSSINTSLMIIIGLSMANGLVALSGGLIAQHQGFADSSMGIGIVVVGLASLIIGESIMKRKFVAYDILAVIVGSIIYRIIITIAFNFLSSPSDLKLISAIIVVIAISYNTVKDYILFNKKKRGH